MWDISGAQSSVGKHSGGAGGYVGQVNTSKIASPVDGIRNSFDMISRGIDSFSSNRLNQEKLAMQREKFSQDMLMQQQKMDMAKDQNQLQAAKYAAAMKQQEFDNQMKMEDNARKQLKSQIELTNFKDKQALGDLIRTNIGTMTKVLEEGTYEDLVGNEEYQTIVAGLSAADPEAGFKHVNDMLKKKAELDKDKRALGTYTLTEDLYLEEVPNAMAALDSGKSIQEAVEPIRLKIAEMYKTGNVDHKAVTSQLKTILQMLNTYKKKSGSSSSVVSFDAEGNQIDPMINPDSVSRQVNTSTGKVTTVGGKSSGNPLKEMMMQKVMESMNKSKGM